MKWLIPPVLVVICVVLMIVLSIVWPIAVIAPAPFNLLGIVLIVAGAVLGASGSRMFVRMKNNLNTFKEPGKLVTDGVFQYTRNPMYLSMVLMLAGVWIFLGVLSPVLCLLLFIIVADRWYIPYEENLLAAKFGSEYATYQTRTRRWI